MLSAHLRARILVALAVVPLGVSGCESSPVVPEGEVFLLATINSMALPAPNPDSQVTEITSGKLTLLPDGRLTGESVVRCRTNLPPNTTCQLQNGGRIPFEGSYSRVEGWVQFGTPRWEGDGLYPAEFTTGAVRITFAVPPSQGFMPLHVFEYRR